MSSAPEVSHEAEGFISLEGLTRLASQLTEDAFTRRFPAPALALTLKLEGPHRRCSPSTGVTLNHLKLMDLDRAESHKSTRMSLAAEALLVSSSPALRYHGSVAFLAKRGGNPFPGMISLGRSMNNDITVLVETVSKIHGYFISREGRWWFTDQHSTNGTALNGVALERGTRNELSDGDRLNLGSGLEGQFLFPAALFARVAKSSRAAPSESREPRAPS